MENNSNDFIKNRPQRLCKMCGRCCRVATTPKTFEELNELAKSGDESAQDFLRLFEPYPSLEEARKVVPEIVDNIIGHLQKGALYEEDKLTFYRCRYIQDNNLCGIYQDRPELCDRFPSTPWAVEPPGCGFEGWLFQKREETKQKIRRQKENLLFLENALLELKNPEQIAKTVELIEKIKNTIDSYSKYGAYDW